MLDKGAIHAAVVGRLTRLGKWQPGCCVPAAVVGCAELNRAGVRAVLQAGTCYWPRFASDDPRIRTDGEARFGFEWQPWSAQTRLMVRAGLTPEVHAWCGLPDTQEVVDFSACLLPDFCREAGREWPGPVPPAPAWFDGPGRPDWVVYDPCPVATAAVALIARRALKGLEEVGGAGLVADWWPVLGGRDGGSLVERFQTACAAVGGGR